MEVYSLDDVDRVIVDRLQQDSLEKTSIAEIARQVGLSAPAVHARIRRLEDEKVIGGYTALINRESLGFEMLCFVQVSLQTHEPETVRQFREQMRELDEVLECHQLIGDIDYLLKVILRNKDDLREFLMETITPIEGVSRIKTSLSLTEIKSTTMLPIDRLMHDD